MCLELKFTRIGTLPENLLRGGSLRCTTPPAAATKRYLRGGKATQSSMIPSHMFAEHQRHRNACEEDLLIGGGALRGGPAGSWNHASMNPPKEYLLHLQPPRRGRVYANRAWILGMWCRATLRLILLQFLSDLYLVDYFSYKTLWYV